MKQIYKGAEAVLWKTKYLMEDAVLKQRIPKTFRHEKIDEHLRKTRTRNEVRMLSKARRYVRTPFVFSVDGDDITMQFISGVSVKDEIHKSAVASKVGAAIRRMHDGGVVHNDLTTSNMILDDSIYFIDFGLAFSSNTLEDIATDLIVFKKMLKAAHYECFERAWKEVMKSYAPSNELMKKMDDVENRVKYK